MSNTENHGYKIPEKGDTDWHIPVNDNFEVFDTEMEIRAPEADKSNYSPKIGTKYLATDTGIVYRGDGSNWVAEFVFPHYDVSGRDSVRVTVGGERALELTAEGGNTAGNVLAGHSSNNMDSGVVGATISGGGYDDGNLVLPNTITGNYGSIGGGFGNETTSDAATVSGGRENTAGDIHATVSGGFDNDASGKGATVSGGESNQATGEHATALGGTGNEASGVASVAAGESTSAAGDNCFTLGKGASTVDSSSGAFVWGDGSDQSFTSSGEDTFQAQAGGGFELYSSSDLSTGAWLKPGESAWSQLSTRTAKTDISPVNSTDVLDRVRGLDISTWEYDSESTATHMGPMAEDFHRAFGLGPDETRISTVDADGVALAAIQGLSEKLDESDERIEEQRAQIDSLEAEIEELSTEINQLQAENEELRNRLAAIEDRIESLGASQAGSITADQSEEIESGG